MGFLDRLFGQADPRPRPTARPTTARVDAALSDDERALQRYRYLLEAAPLETIEQAHAEAFASLTPEQRRAVLDTLSRQVPARERAGSDDPRAMARIATQAELRKPGIMERTFAAMPTGGMGMGGMIAGTLLASIAGAVIGSAIAQSFFADNPSAFEDDQALSDDSTVDGTGDEQDSEVSDESGGDWGGDAGGGDIGGGDFGGGDF